MRMGSYEFRPGIIPTLAFLLVFPVLLSLGNWQLNRAEEKQQLDIERQQQSKGESLDLNLLGEIRREDRYRKASVSGQYVNGKHWLQDNQVVDGQVGYHVFSLFKLDTAFEKYILVDRGWLALGENRSVLPDVTAPTGNFVLQGRLDNPASVGIRMGQPDYAVETVLPYLDIGDFAKSVSLPVMMYALILDDQQPGVFRHDWEQTAEMTPEKHIGYATQWFALALALAVIYLGVNLHKIEQEESHV